MPRNSDSYTFGFAAVVCVACSLVVSAGATLLKTRQEANARLDVQRNILRAVGLIEPGLRPAPSEVEELYASRIEGLVLDRSGRIVPGRKPEELDPEKDKGLLPLYLRKEDGRTAAYAFPVSGKGLWSTLYGYLALEPDGTTVKGITFYKHGETPGLGAEIEKEWFQRNFAGKKVLDEKGRLVSVTVVKGRVEDSVPPARRQHYVDGISGATITSKGVTQLVRAGLQSYDPFFQEIRREAKR